MTQRLGRQPRPHPFLRKAVEWTERGDAAKADGDADRASRCYDFSTFWYNKYENRSGPKPLPMRGLKL